MEFYTFDLATTLRLTLNIMQFKIPIYNNSTFQLCILPYLIKKKKKMLPKPAHKISSSTQKQIEQLKKF